MSSRARHDGPQPLGSGEHDKDKRLAICDDDENGDMNVSGAAGESSAVQCNVDASLPADPVNISLHHYGDDHSASRDGEYPVRQRLRSVCVLCYYADQTCCSFKCHLPSCRRN